MKINWKVRIKNKVFWCALLPALLLLIKQVLDVFGIVIDIETLNTQLLSIINTVFIILALLGIVIDPTTPGGNDSDLAMTYERFDIAEQDSRGSGIEEFLEEESKEK